MVGITFRDIPSDSRAFARDHEANWILAQGGDHDTAARDYGIRAVPQTFFIDRRGMVVRRVVGYIDGETMESYVLELFER